MKVLVHIGRNSYQKKRKKSQQTAQMKYHNASYSDIFNFWKILQILHYNRLLIVFKKKIVAV